MKRAADVVLQNAERWGNLGQEIPKPYKRPGGLKWAAKQWKSNVGLAPPGLDSPKAVGDLGKKLLQGWVEAKARGIEMGGAHRDLGIMTLCGAIADMAYTIRKSLNASIPKPNIDWMGAVYTGRQLHSAFPKDAAKIIARGKSIGLKAADGFISRLGRKSINIQERAPSKWYGTGLQPPELTDSGITKSDCAIVYLLALKHKLQTRPRVYAYVMERLAQRGIRLGGA